MPVQVGIPRGLLYYEYFPLWKRFFNNLDAEVVESPLTTKQWLEMGVRHSVDETCLPVKLYMGHVAALKDVVDYLFIPRIVSTKHNDYYCPKFSGLPDMVRNAFRTLPPILEVVADRTEDRKQFRKTLYQTGGTFTRNPLRIYQAYNDALHYWKQTKREWQNQFIPQPAADVDTPLTLAIIGHSYNIYDGYSSNNLLRTLAKMGVGVVTPDTIAYRQAIHTTETCLPGMFWSLGKKLYGGTMDFAQREDVDGVVLIMAFECGPDSMLMELLTREITSQYNKPVMTLVMDEHTGEAGLVTRLEAFVDMVKRRKRL
jgi:predicted nucleotide-binding protein (sugar kinase/HSP70/actin superfamily)